MIDAAIKGAEKRGVGNGGGGNKSCGQRWRLERGSKKNRNNLFFLFTSDPPVGGGPR